MSATDAAASAKDVEPLFEGLRGRRRVVALDLPGFGLSERSERSYTPALYVNAVAALLRQVAPTGADVVALSLSSEHVAAVAREHPSLVHSLSLISPTGFTRPREQPRAERAARAGKPIKRGWLRTHAVDPLLFSLLSSRLSLRVFLRRSFSGAVNEELLSYAYDTSHRPGAFHAPAAFIAGGLFPAGKPLDAYAHVRCPTLVLFDQDAYVSFDELPAFVSTHPQWKAVRIFPTRGLPHFEAPQRTVEALEAHWASCAAVDPAEDTAQEKRR